MKNHIIILFLLLGFFPVTNKTFAQDTNDYEPLDILDVKYDYTMNKSNYGRWTTSGSLIITLSLLDNVERYMICFDRTFQSEEHNRWMGKVFYQPVNDIITWPDVSNHLRFFIRGYADGIWKYKSKVINVDDYISESDLKLINGQTSIDQIQSNPSPILLINDRLHNISLKPLNVNIVDINGVQLLSCIINPEEVISLSEYSNKYLIIQYSIDNQIITQKIHIP